MLTNTAPFLERNLTLKMIGKFTQRCRMGTCRCGNAHDGKGRKQERRTAKRQERQTFKNSDKENQ